jgi:cation transport regulator ChaB
MPYDTLPARYRDLIPSEDGQAMFRNALNAQLAAGKTEEVAFASAWAALARAGYEKGEDGKWVKKTMPTMSQVHAPGAEWDDTETHKAYGASPIYMYRPVLNAEMLHEWAAAQGFPSALPPDDMHVTVVYSKAAFSAELSRIAAVNGVVLSGNVIVRGGKRAVVPLGDKGAVVLKVQSDALQSEHMMFRSMGASWDYQEYTPHISITYQGRGISVADMQPFTDDIVLGPLCAKPIETEWAGDVAEVALGVEKAETYQPPAAARNNARRVLAWREEHGDDVKGMTAVGWTRARQLASGKPISRDIVARMSAFNRHRQNAEVAPEYKDEPWRDAGHVAWRGWGGTTGVDWARSIMERLNKGAPYEDDVAMSEDEMDDMDGVADADEGETEDEAGENEGLLERVISGIMRATMAYEMHKSAEVLKLDSERRIAWGWASVSTVDGQPVTDTQGDTITPAEMEKMADRFMASARTAKAMHEGDQIGEVLHSLPLTAELAKAFGMETDREGWIIGMKVHDDAVWQGFKEGRYKAFSIGGKAKRTPK